MEEAGIQGDQVVEFVAVNLVHRGQDGQGPIDGVGQVGTEGLVAELVHFDAHFNALQEGGGTLGSMAVGRAALGQGRLLLHPTGEDAVVGGSVHREQRVQLVVAPVDLPAPSLVG